jgi:beta-lactamase regulating signal transducer with metallopeptidase domain
MTDLLQLGLSNALGATALAAVVAIPALLLRRKSPAAVHALWLVVLLKLVTPPLWKVPVSWPPATPSEQAEVAPHEEADDEEAAPPTPEMVEAPAPTVATDPAAPLAPPADWTRIAAAAAAALWLGGSAACLVLITTRTWRFARLLRHAEPVPLDVRLRAEAISSRFGLRGCPAVLFVPGAVCPMLWAAFGPARLLLPRGLWGRLDDDQRDTLIAHELAHLRRRDHWVRLIEVVATVLYWWHPVLWWARRQLRDAEEQCCDAWVVWSAPTPAGVRHYMSAILEAVEFVSEPFAAGPFVSEPNRSGRRAPAAVPALASGMGEFRRLERRLWMIRSSETPRRLGRPGLAGILLAAGAALPLAPTLAQVEAPTTDTRQVVVTASADRPGAEGATSSSAAGGISITSASADVAPSAGGASSAAGEISITSADAAPSAGGADNRQTVTLDSRTGNKIVFDGKDVHIVSQDEVQQARMEVEKLSAQLAQAKQRLKELEKRGKGEKGNTKDGPEAKNADARTRYITKKEDVRWEVKPETAWQAKIAPDKGGDDQQRRLDRLEQKMDKLDELLNELREMRGRERGDKAEKKEAAKRQ